MTIARKTQIGLITLAVVLFVLLFIAPKKQKVSEAPLANTESLTLDPFLMMALKTLKPVDKNIHDQLLAVANQSKDDTAYNVLVGFWDKVKRPDFAAYYAEKTAEKLSTSVAYAKAGDRYYYAVRFVKDQAEIPVLYQSAARCYEKASEKDPKNTDAKIQLASCYVESSSDPMKGIALLREVEKTDSNNVKLQLSFAFFSVKSGQWEKAIHRFEKVLVIDPLYIEAYLHLADAYEQQGNTPKTIEMLQAYANTTTDATAKQEVLKYIEQLKRK